MSGLSVSEPTAAPQARPGRSDLLRTLVSAVVVLVVFAVVGAAAGWLWHHLWTPPSGLALQPRNQDGSPAGAMQWYPVRGSAKGISTDETSLGQDFGATGLFIVIGVVAGLVLGLVTALAVRRHELVVLPAVVVGGVIATFLCYRVGIHLSPPDPNTVAATAKEYTPIPDDMQVSGHSPYVAWVLGALIGLGFTYLLTSASTRPAPNYPPQPGLTPGEQTWLSGNQPG